MVWRVCGSEHVDGQAWRRLSIVCLRLGWPGNETEAVGAALAESMTSHDWA